MMASAPWDSTEVLVVVAWVKDESLKEVSVVLILLVDWSTTASDDEEDAITTESAERHRLHSLVRSLKIHLIQIFK